MVHEPEGVGPEGCQVEIVEDHEDADVLGGLMASDAHDVQGVFGVEAGGGLVHEEIARGGWILGPELGQGSGEVDALAFAAGEGGVGLVGAVGEADLGKDLGDDVVGVSVVGLGE